MQATADPYPGSSESLATDGVGELQRLRYVIKQITGEAQWYIDPDIDLSVLDLEHSTDGTHKHQALNPVGMVSPYAGSTAPTGWLLCDGSAVSRTTYADLFTVVSTTYGVGDGSTTFNVPDLRGRYPLGKDNMGAVRLIE